MDLLLLSIFTRNRYCNTKDSFTLEYLCQPARMAHYVRYGTKHGISCVLWQVIVRFISIDLNLKHLHSEFQMVSLSVCQLISRENVILSNVILISIKYVYQTKFVIVQVLNCCIYILCIIYISEMQSRSYHRHPHVKIPLLFERTLKSPFHLEIH